MGGAVVFGLARALLFSAQALVQGLRQEVEHLHRLSSAVNSAEAVTEEERLAATGPSDSSEEGEEAPRKAPWPDKPIHIVFKDRCPHCDKIHQHSGFFMPPSKDGNWGPKWSTDHKEAAARHHGLPELGIDAVPDLTSDDAS